MEKALVTTLPIITTTITTTGDEPSWAELLGSDNWEGLLDPLDLSLRSFILRCGDFCQATYDSFENDNNSKNAGNSRYGPKDFFNRVMLENAADYQVSGFLYATAEPRLRQAMFVNSLSHDCWDRNSNFMGYVATTTDEVSRALGRREIYVAWRGTETAHEWKDVLNPIPSSAEQLLAKHEPHERVPYVMNGWLKIYVSSDAKSPFTKESARAQLHQKIQELRETYKDEQLSITITGHSLGACLALLSAFDLVENGVRDIPVAAIVFASPKVGDNEFNKRVNRFPNLKILHVKNVHDLIPLYPSFILGYADTGVKLEMDSKKSPYLKNPILDISEITSWNWHNLQGLLHVVAGWNGEKGKFEMKVKRSLALVNKSCDYVKRKYNIPASWWVEKNKGLIRDENGEWVYADITP